MKKSEWVERNDVLDKKLKEKEDAISDAHQIQNANRHYTILIESIQELMKDKYQKIEAPKTQNKPYLSFRDKHVRRPDIPQLPKAIEAGETTVAENLTNNISRDR